MTLSRRFQPTCSVVHRLLHTHTRTRTNTHIPPHTHAHTHAHTHTHSRAHTHTTVHQLSLSQSYILWLSHSSSSSHLPHTKDSGTWWLNTSKMLTNAVNRALSGRPSICLFFFFVCFGVQPVSMCSGICYISSGVMGHLRDGKYIVELGFARQSTPIALPRTGVVFKPW